MNISILRRYCLCLAALFGLGTHAAPVTPDQALNRAAASAPRQVAAQHVPTFRLALTVKDSASHAAVYVMQCDGRYVILPADDCAPAVLGYGDNFSATDIPPAMQWWLDNYATQVEHMAANGMSAPAQVSPAHDRVPYLIQTTWNQSAPYNNKCPMSDGSRSVTGCVATAMAQVINYHRCPAGTGTGTYSYIWNGMTLSFDYGATSFDWNNMLDSYKSNYTSAQANAVATLMYGAGVSVEMNYSPQSSAAFSFRISEALVNHFGFDPSAQYVRRKYYSDEAWDGLIYAELEAGRPVIYRGGSDHSAHCFICDGYEEDGYYHINWGWGGKSDGYFLLSALNPYDQGIGGADTGSGYNYDQEAVIGVRPLTDNPGAQALYILANGGFEYSPYYHAFWFGETDNGMNGYYNYSSNTVTVTPGVALSSPSCENLYIKGKQETLEGYTPGVGFHGKLRIYAYLPYVLEAGSYQVSPVVMAEGMSQWQPIGIPYGMNQYITIRVAENGAMTMDGSDPSSLPAPCYVVLEPSTTEAIPNGKVTVNATIFNPGKETVTFQPSLLMLDSNGEVTNPVRYYTIDVEPGSARYRLSMNVADVPDGVYRIKALDYTVSRWASEGVEVYVGTVPASVSLSPEKDQIKVGESFKIDVTVLPENAFDRKVTWTSSDESIATVDANGKVTGVSVGSATITATTINHLSAATNVNVISDTGVSDVKVDAESEITEIYDINGRLVGNALEGLRPGIYLLKRGNTVAKQVIR